MRVAQTVPGLFQDTAKTWIEGARATARRLLRTRHRITIEDVLKEYPLPKYLHRNNVGQVFRDPTVFQAVGYTHAKKLSSNGRTIRYWALTDQYADKGEYDCN